LVLWFELRAFTLRHSTSPIFVMGIFEIGSHELFAWGWFQTMILLISTSWVARISVVSHWCLARPHFLYLICCDMLRLVLCLDCCEECCNSHGHSCFQQTGFVSFGKCTQKWSYSFIW
jgi:hypothetical protein